MALEAHITDLRFAEQFNKAVWVSLFRQGDLVLVGVHEVNEVEGCVSLWTPKAQGDDTSRTRVRLDDIASVMVETDIDWNAA